MLEFTNLGGVRVLIHKGDAPTRLNRHAMTHDSQDNTTGAPVRSTKGVKRGNPERVAL